MTRKYYCAQCDSHVDDINHDCTMNSTVSLTLLALRERDKVVWNEAIEKVARELKSSYPDHAAINAYCACVRSLLK